MSYREETRPFISIDWPTWDGKLVLAGIFIVGYYTLVILMVVLGNDLAQSKAGIVRDAMLTLGPPIGLIFGALFRVTGAEERRDILRSTELQTAITTPSTVSPDVSSAVEAGVTRGLDKAEPVKVEPTRAPLAADGVRRDWLDPPWPQQSGGVSAPDNGTVAVNSATPVLED